MESTADQAGTATEGGYEAPSLIELGTVVELTNGSGQLDTADMRQWYN